MSRLKILLISGYDAKSHRFWRESLASHISGFDWTQIALPARHFSWRVRGGALNIYLEHQQQLNQHFDLVLATSMVDLAALRGLVPKLSQVPNILYFHENQFVYPISRQQPNILNAQLTSFYSALAADEVWFNSEYNQRSFRSGLKEFLRKIPDKSSIDIDQWLGSRSSIMPVPINQPESNFNILDKGTETPHILWNHRWEYDKQPEVFFDALRLLKQQKIDFRLSVVGESFRKVPECFACAKSDFQQEILHWGYQSRRNYQQILSDADFVVSSATHDFQGLSMLEAISYGCIPIAPDRLVYPEYIPSDCLYPLDHKEESQSLASLIVQKINNKTVQPIDIEKFYRNNLIPIYNDRLNQVLLKSRKNR